MVFVNEKDRVMFESFVSESNSQNKLIALSNTVGKTLGAIKTNRLFESKIHSAILKETGLEAIDRLEIIDIVHGKSLFIKAHCRDGQRDWPAYFNLFLINQY